MESQRPADPVVKAMEAAREAVMIAPEKPPALVREDSFLSASSNQSETGPTTETIVEEEGEGAGDKAAAAEEPQESGEGVAVTAEAAVTTDAQPSVPLPPAAGIDEGNRSSDILNARRQQAMGKKVALAQENPGAEALDQFYVRVLSLTDFPLCDLTRRR